MARNIVIAGDYEGKRLFNGFNHVGLMLGLIKSIKLTKEEIESYEVMDEESRTSATSAVGRGLVGSFLLGPIGAVAALSAKKKGTHVIAIQFKDGKKSLIEIDNKLYKILIKSLF